MTLIIGIKCSNGVVVGADGAATFSTVMGDPTILQPINKVKIVNNTMILAVTGSIGLGQRFFGRLQTLDLARLEFQNSFSAMTNLRHQLLQEILPELEAAIAMHSLVGEKANSAAIAACLIALPVANSPCLFQFDKQAAPEEATEDLPFATLGSAQAIADPFLAFLRRVFWEKRLPNLQEGVLATYWSLEHAILTNAGGVANPKSIAVLRQVDGNWQADLLSDEDLLEHENAVKAAEHALRDHFQQENDLPAPEPPLPLPDLPAEAPEQHAP